MKKTMLVLCAAGAMMLVGCAKGHRGGAEMGAVSGSDCQKSECCKNKDKAAMGAVSGSSCSEKKDCATKCKGDKASMGAVSGEKKDCATKCPSAK